MKKRFPSSVLAVLLAAVLMLTMTVPAFAVEYGYESDGCAAVFGKRILAAAIVATANIKIEILVGIARITPDPDIAGLQASAANISQRAVKDCAELGVLVECVDEVYIIHGQPVVIDPLRVVG